MENYQEPWQRSRNRVIGGVCGGIAEKLHIDPVVVRLIFVMLLIFAGGGLIIYLILWVVLPEAPWLPPGQTASAGQVYENTIPGPLHDSSNNPTDFGKPSRTQLVLGLFLIGFGVLFLIAAFVPAFNVHDLWPLALIFFGLFLLKPVSNKN